MFSATLIFLFLIKSTCAVLLFKDDNCTVPGTNEPGRCIEIDKCSYAKNLLENDTDPGFCGFIRNIPLTCCPVFEKLNALKPGNLTREMCKKYTDQANIAPSIELGSRALSKEFPHMAAVGYGKNKSNIVWLCGGTLISHYFVLSAAHCAESSEFGPARWIRLGDLDLKNNTEDANPLDLQIVKIHTHPGYNSSSHYHDVALFKLVYVTFGEYFYPACLQTKETIPVDKLVAAGWGRLGFFGESSSHLMKVELEVVNYNICKKKYSDPNSRRKLKEGIWHESQICAGNVEGGDTCPGDSGGPLHYFVGTEGPYVSHFVVVGITSFGKGCGGENSVGVYTRVSGYVGWIENIVWPEIIL